MWWHVLWNTDHISLGLWNLWHLERQSCKLSFLIIYDKELYKTFKCLVCEKITHIIWTAVSYDQNCLSWICQWSPCVIIWIDNNNLFEKHRRVSNPTYLLQIDTYMKKKLKYVLTNVISLFWYRRNTQRPGTMKMICKSFKSPS